MRIILISCVSKKEHIGEGETLPAQRLYTSSLFKKAWSYANELSHDRIYILSAKYGLLSPEKPIGYYNETLLKYSASKQKEWAENILSQLRNEGCDLGNDEFILLAGKAYYKNLLGNNRIRNYELPYKGLKGIGFILKFLTEKIKQNNYEKH